MLVLRSSSFALAILGTVKYAEDQNLVGIGDPSLIHNNVGQPAHHPFVGTINAASMTYAREFSQTLGSQPDARGDLRRCERVTFPDCGFRRYAPALPRYGAASQAA